MRLFFNVLVYTYTCVDISVVTKDLLTSHGYVTTPYKLVGEMVVLYVSNLINFINKHDMPRAPVPMEPQSESKLRSIRFCSLVASMSAKRCLATGGHARSMNGYIITSR